MAISRMQEPRQQYGLGSFVKKITKKATKPFTKIAKKLVPKEIAGIMRVAAPFLPPGYREAAYLLGTAKQTGRISPLDLALTLAPTVGKMKIGQSGQTISQRLGAMNLPFTDKNLKEVLVGSPRDINFMEREGPTRQFFSDMDGSGFMAGKPLGGQNIVNEATQGLIGSGGQMFQFGSGQGLKEFATDTNIGRILLGDKEGKGISLAKAAGIGAGIFSLIADAKTPDEAGRMLVAETGDPFDYERGKELFGQLPSDAFKIPDRFVLSKDGGLIRKNFALGTMPTDQEQGLGGLPIEADMRYTGGFMPYGAVEKADDVPARLSKNEFVFTADAVRAAGGGSVQKGAKRMYDTMKKLESQPEAKGMA
mgnify:CR=1 FL=1